MNMMTKISKAEHQADRGAWQAALATYRRAAAAHEEACSVTDEALKRYYAERPDDREHPEISERTGLVVASAAQDAACAADAESHSALLATPSPDLAAVITKLELSRIDGVDHRDIPHLIADLRRLSSEPKGRDAACHDRQWAGAATISSDPHPSWLGERDEVMARLEPPRSEVSDEEADMAAARLNVLDNLILETPATSRDGAAAKLLTIVKAISEGHGIVEEDAARVVAEVQPLVGTPAQKGIGLSPFMAQAVSEWAIISRAFGAFYGSNEAGDALCEANARALRAVAELPAASFEDVAVKTYLLALEECDLAGPQALKYEASPEGENYHTTHLWRGIISDLPRVSPAVRDLIASAA